MDLLFELPGEGHPSTAASGTRSAHVLCVYVLCSTATCASVRLPSSCPPARLPPCLPTHLVQSAQATVRNYHGPGNLNSRLHVSQFWRLRNPRLRQIHFLVRCLLPAFSQPPRCCALTWQREKFSCHFLFFEQL